MKPRDIHIHPVLNGFVVRVGCQNVVIGSADELGRRITEYYKDPARTEELFIRGKVNDTLGPEVVDNQECAAQSLRECVPMTGEPLRR